MHTWVWFIGLAVQCWDNRDLKKIGQKAPQRAEEFILQVPSATAALHHFEITIHKYIPQENRSAV
jgi:hypothetical protein